ncbi:tellurite resistance TerB C-terminal domain-containing protein [Chryseobacterium taklimakanense]|uniref:tellurite resistance TerB C-terminal domain-containing protein n=1 Tax=Chryseobacterium taklimakanense TaxID=536441 RepID=UPI0013DD921E|nr:tellurite resistance TerB C-terminal domain-containing protein [Chryseobacterium taklimakanense]
MNIDDPSSNDDIIDVSGLMSTLFKVNITSNSSVPYWPHQYIYSFSEINNATQEQKEFYTKFKNEFLNRNFIYLNGNNNYAFILLFDLLNEFEAHRDFPKIERQLEDLGNNYPRTKSYCVSFLIKKLEEYGMDTETDQFREKNQQYDYDYWKLGKRYKKKLNLSQNEEQILNSVWLQSNVFNQIEFCRVEILRQFLRCVEFLNRHYFPTDNTLKTIEEEFSDIIVRKEFRYRKGSQNYKYTFDIVKGEIFGHILKLSENNVREAFGNKRKLTAEFKYKFSETYTSYNERVVSKLDSFLVTDQENISTPDIEVERSLNENNTTRWKIKFEKIEQNYTTGEDFESKIKQLAEENNKNPAVEAIFFEGSKFIAKTNKISALRLYLHYIDADLKSTEFNNKKLNKTLQKNLFQTNEQLQDFEDIVNNFISDKNLEDALKKVSSLYAPKRKKISIDTSAILEVEKLHSGTVNLLNEYLQEEDESPKTEEINSEETVEINIKPQFEPSLNSKFILELNLSEIQQDVLELFEKSNYSLLQADLQQFLKDKNLMMGSVIDSINEICFEILDDVLIEEDGDYFTISPNYYKKILQND